MGRSASYGGVACIFLVVEPYNFVWASPESAASLRCCCRLYKSHVKPRAVRKSITDSEASGSQLRPMKALHQSP